MLLGAPAALPGADFQDLLKGGLDQWEALGDGIWSVRSDGVLVGYRRPDRSALWAGGETVTKKQYHDWEIVQAWLYTKGEYDEYDLHVDYWIRTPGNSGIAIRDPLRGRHGMTRPPDFSRTPSKTAYEIQINSAWPDPWPTGSIYGLAKAREGLQREGEWNSLNIESRKSGIRVLVNGEVAAAHPGDPARPAKGPIGLQLHDQSSLVMFRNLWILER
jgi:hypothetical protein